MDSFILWLFWLVLMDTNIFIYLFGQHYWSLFNDFILYHRIKICGNLFLVIMYGFLSLALFDLWLILYGVMKLFYLMNF